MQAMKNKVNVKLLGVIKGIAKADSVELELNEEEENLVDILKRLAERYGNEMKNRLFSGEDKVAPDLMISYEDRVFPARGNEKALIKKGSQITIFSFVHGG